MPRNMVIACIVNPASKCSGVEMPLNQSQIILAILNIVILILPRIIRFQKIINKKRILKPQQVANAVIANLILPLSYFFSLSNITSIALSNCGSLPFILSSKLFTTFISGCTPSNSRSLPSKV